MKVVNTNRVPCPNEFRPFDITLRMETLKDAQDLRFIFNYCPITDGLSLSNTWAVRQAISEMAGNAADDGFAERIAAIRNRVR